MATTIIILAILAVTQAAMSAVSPSPNTFFPDINRNLTKVTWDHAVNNKTKLKDAMASGVMMLEADVILGHLGNNTGMTPVMGHPPNTSSDLSLEEFLDTVVKNGTKGIKLDFKSYKAFNESIPILEKHKAIKVPLWINADVLLGPVGATTNDAEPVNPKDFIDGVKKIIPESTLSVGWVTRYGSKHNIATGNYTTEQVRDMLKVIKDNNVVQPVTYPVRAGLAANNIEAMKALLKNSTADATLTIWSSEGDVVDGKNLTKLIKEIGLDKVYLDVPEIVLKTLDLSKSGGSYLVSNLAVTIVSIFVTAFVSRIL